ncbi:MAG: peptide chain release factor 2 [Thermoanaerobaculia bacterium]|nr:peptide chain release factor 2 [Thermoanaerobaculia bacterium]
MTIEQLKELKEKLAVLRRYLDVDNRLREIEDLTSQTLDPNFWNDPKRAEGIQRKIGLNKKWVDEYNDLAREIDDLEGLYEFQKEGMASEAEVDAQYARAADILADAEFRSTLNQKEDPMNAVLTINAGAGGTEACDWSAMLLRMYTMWAEKSGFKVVELFEQEGDAAGIKSASIEIRGDYAYGWLKGENGVHRLVRVSPFNAQGKRQTSFSSVFVYPLVEDDSIEVVIKPDDIEMDVFRASGAGGQHVNRTESAVRLRHLPSGVVVECQAERSQHQNRDRAMQMLKSRLYEIELRKRQEEKDKIEAGKSKIEWGSQIRSYVLDDRWVKDLRTGYKVHNPDAVLDGDLDGFLKAYLMWQSNPVPVEEE